MSLSRRELLRAGGYLCVAFTVFPTTVCGQDAGPLPPMVRRNPRLDSWLRIESNRTVSLLTGRAELGQGIQTALAQIAAEELDVSFEQIIAQHVDTEISADEGYTYGSISVQLGGHAVRAAAAHARQLLLEQAAAQLNLDVSVLAVKNGVVRHNGQATGLDYWSLVDGKQLDIDVSPSPQKSVEAYRIVGSSVARVDIPAIVFAGSVFIQDMQMVNTLHARVVKPPYLAARLVAIDVADIAEMIGDAKLICDGSFVAVVADAEFSVVKGASLVVDHCKWTAVKDADRFESVREWLVSARAQNRLVHATGAMSEPGAISYRATFFRPFQAHASISPSMAWALWENKKLTIWTHAQGMYPLRGAIARVVGLEEDQVRCIHRQSSGVYGQNGADDAACDAALIAMKMPGRPVRLQYSRQDEFAVEPYGSAMLMQVEATTDDTGQLRSWRYIVKSGPHSNRPDGSRFAGRLQSAGLINNALPTPASVPVPLPNGGAERNAIPLYSIPSVAVERDFVSHMPARVSSLRALGAYANIFAIESSMSELASRHGQDEFSYRMRHLDDARALRVLTLLRTLCEYHDSATKDIRGIAWGRYKNSAAYCGVAAYVTRTNQGLQVSNLIIVVDAGLIINPDGARNQIEGGAIQATSWTLKESVRLTQQGTPSRDWATYPILRFSEVPAVRVEFIVDPAETALGVGEASQGPTGAAIANAVANLTGKRIRDLPIQL